MFMCVIAKCIFVMFRLLTLIKSGFVSVLFVKCVMYTLIKTGNKRMKYNYSECQKHISNKNQLHIQKYMYFVIPKCIVLDSIKVGHS